MFSLMRSSLTRHLSLPATPARTYLSLGSTPEIEDDILKTHVCTELRLTRQYAMAVNVATNNRLNLLSTATLVSGQTFFLSFTSQSMKPDEDPLLSLEKRYIVFDPNTHNSNSFNY